MDNNILCKIHTVVVHGGNFHADDLFTVAYLLKYFDLIGVPITYKRTFQITDEMTLENGYIVADIGLGEFDHHQKEELKQKDKQILYQSSTLFKHLLSVVNPIPSKSHTPYDN